jgi:uncharacterized membrane protein YphA (DoxX/SURF4 family)
MGVNRNWQEKPKDNYQEWLLKSIPSEVIALYLSIHSLLMSWTDRPSVVMWVFLILCTIAAPLLLFMGGVRRISQFIVATLAVPVWAMSIPQSAWWTIDGWHPAIGGAIIAVYVVAIGPGIAAIVTKFEH